MKRPRKILFIGHEASLSGAPILLLNLLLLLREDAGVNVSVVIRRYGPFLPEYERHFKVIVLKGKNYSSEKRIYQRIIHILKNRIDLVRIFITALFSDLIVSNTIANGRLLKSLRFFKHKTIVYVHELEKVIVWYMPASGYSLQYSNRIAYPSRKVAGVLKDVYAVSAERLAPLSYFFPFKPGSDLNPETKERMKNAFRKRFNIRDQFVVGNVGVLCKRKGTDLFVEVCSQVVKNNPDIKFCWIGSFEDDVIQKEIRALIDSKGISDNIILTGPLEHQYYNFCNFDLLFLSSREDPYPLVVIESAFMSVPCMCFEDSGGITEFVDKDSGWIIHKFSIDEAASKILELYGNRTEIIDKGKNAAAKALTMHADKQKIIAQFNDLISTI